MKYPKLIACSCALGVTAILVYEFVMVYRYVSMLWHSIRSVHRAILHKGRSENENAYEEANHFAVNLRHP